MQNKLVYGGYDAGVQPDGSVNVLGAGYLKRSSVAGSSLFCYYDKLGKTTSIMIASHQICPQMN